MNKHVLILASASPRRAELLRQIGVSFEVKAVDIDETPTSHEPPDEYVRRLAIEKALMAKSLDETEGRWFLGSDTSVVVDDDILGKPENKQHGVSMLKQLSARSHRVLTSVALVGQGVSECVVSESIVTFASLNDEEINAYWETGEPVGKAGSYAIQGRAAQYISRIEGSFSGVMGLPLYETSVLLRQHSLI